MNCKALSAVCLKCGNDHLTHRCPEAIVASTRKRKSYIQALLGSNPPPTLSMVEKEDKPHSSTPTVSITPKEYLDEIKQLQDTIVLLKKQIKELSDELHKRTSSFKDSPQRETNTPDPKVLSRKSPTTSQSSAPRSSNADSISNSSGSYRLAIEKLRQTKSVSAALRILEDMDTSARDMDDYMHDPLICNDDAMSALHD